MELYSIGILRNDQEHCNLRYLGGPEMSKLFVAERPTFAKNPVIARSESSFVEEPPTTWFEFALKTRNNHIHFDVDGRSMIDHVDTGTVVLSHSQWNPLTNGGCIAFRNFRATTMCLDYITVYQAKQN